MPRRLIDLASAPLLDIASYARRGPGRRDRLSPAEIELIARTAYRTPEVMVKVLTRGGQDLRAVRRHLEYLDRKGELEIETDDGQKLSGKGVERELLEDWDLDIEEDRCRANLEARPDSRSPPKLVHKVLFSMPPGTPPKKVLEAVKNFAREEFAEAPVCDGPTHRRAASARTYGRQGSERAGGAPEYTEGDITSLEEGIRAPSTDTRSASECDGAGSAWSEPITEARWGLSGPATRGIPMDSSASGGSRRGQ